VLVEVGKRHFYAVPTRGTPIALPRPPHEWRIHHRASRWSTRHGPRVRTIQ
jgi:hypothetical protein